MISEKEQTQISKFLSLVLRHQPELINLKIESSGWTDVEDLIAKANDYGIKFDRQILEYIVANNSKKRFAFNSTFDKIRASQGHSIETDLGYINQQPPMQLYHGTSEKSVEAILELGIDKRSRQHVHLSAEIDTALSVGRRHGKPVIFLVHSGKMYDDGFAFYLSENDVWLVNHVPSKYLEIAKNERT